MSLTSDQLQSIYTYKSSSLSYKCSDGQIRQEYVRLEADRVQNSEVSRDNYGNSKIKME